MCFKAHTAYTVEENWSKLVHMQKNTVKHVFTMIRTSALWLGNIWRIETTVVAASCCRDAQTLETEGDTYLIEGQQ